MAICRDLFAGNSATVLQSLPLDWLLVPSMSNKLSPHNEKAKYLHDTKGAIIAVANQQMPDAEEYEPGFVYHDENEKAENELSIITIQHPDIKLKVVR